MARTISIGAQGFADIRERGAFLVDKTAFIREWWKAYDDATLICRPRRFGKTLNLDMLDCFFSTRYANRSDLFEGLDVWEDADMRTLQGSWPVISLSFSDVKSCDYDDMIGRVAVRIADIYQSYRPVLESTCSPEEWEYARRIMSEEGDSADLASSIRRLCGFLANALGKKVIVLLDEYDTPLQEAWICGYWDRASAFFRGFFNSSLKANEHLERALVTGITRVARESIFSDLNNLEVVTASSRKYETAFGFTQDEVDAALDEFGMQDRAGVRAWYDGFKFGNATDIYNPWSITNYLDKGILGAYWANTSANGLVSSLVGHSDAQMKSDFETLLTGGVVRERIDEQIAFPDLDYDPAAVWSLLVGSGYLKILEIDFLTGMCQLAITNYETRIAFDGMVRRWFAPVRVAYNGFVRALLAGDLKAMNAYMNDVALDTFSTFDTGNRPSGAEPERFYHGFVLGLLVELRGRYRVLSNRESGYGRYDVMLVPDDAVSDPGIVMEFKVRDAADEKGLAETVAAALEQIKEKRYAAQLIAEGVHEDRIRCYGLAFEGKRVLIGTA